MARPPPNNQGQMIGPPPTFYDSEWDYQQQQQQQQQQQFQFAYPAPGPSYNELLAQYYYPAPVQPQSPTSTSASSYVPAPSLSPPVNQAARARSKRTAASTSASTSHAHSNSNNSAPPASTSHTPPAPKRKRTKKAAAAPPPQQAYSDSESDDGLGGVDGNGVGISVGMAGLGVRSRGPRLTGACTHCKKLKMRCEFGSIPPGDDGEGGVDNTCRRCRAGGHVCIVEGRKPRSAPNKREYLLAQIRQKDAIIESLLKQLHNPYIATPLSIASYRMATSPSDAGNRNIIAWLDRLTASVRSGEASVSSPHFGSANPNFKSAAFSSTNPGFAASNPAFEESASEDEGVGNEGGTDEGAGEGEGGESSALPDATVPLGLIANLSLSNRSGKERRGARAGEPPTREEELEDLDDDNVGVANAAYFMPGPATDLGMRAQLIEQHSPPEILIHGLVVPEDVDKLFDIFYNRVNPFIAILDPVLHTPASTFARCPFLFTVICAISSRYYPEKSEIYPIAMHFAKHSAANALIDGWKSVELVQAYLLMSIYAVPARKWEEDRQWLYTGLAIRLATDLNLHQVTGKVKGNEKQQREMLNRTRVWMICFNLDRSTATQFGKPSTVKEQDVMRHGGDDWYKKYQYNSPYDVHMCCYTALLRTVGSFHDELFSDQTSPSGLNKRIDFRTVTLMHDERLSRFSEEWAQRFEAESDPNDRKAVMRCKLLPFLTAYSRLVMFSFGFQQAYQRGLQPADYIFFSKCLDSAKCVVRSMVEELVPTGFIRYAPDGHFIFCAFASAFLLKLLRPEFSHLMVKEEENEVFDLIGRLIQTLSSPDVAIDDRHTPKLYARFLAGLLSHHRRDGATVGRLHPQPPPPQNYAGSSSSDYTHSGSTSSSFTTSPMPGAGASHHVDPNAQSYTRVFSQAETASTPIYRADATYTGPVQYGTDGMDLGTGVPDEEQMLAAMQALKNPAWWDNMMMPGFSWPDSSSGHSPSSNASNESPSPYHQPQISPSFSGSFHHPPHPMEAPQFVV